ncbi:MAG: hypothetical protein CVU16_13785 [Betaproteobacteria bacterium HGW-Betaproteobacteria-10]|nr:MAG: hypothetical protein CVU16_13785 [Betaproteobacteria bacterium HGW-Betaproteobacteria-10]
MQTQRKATKPQRAVRRLARPEFTAAVRYLDGRRDIFHVLNADDLADARALVLTELGELQSLVIALRH